MTAIAHSILKRPTWRTATIAALAFWLSGSLILDLVIMPSLYAAGMMNQADFATAGYSVFWIFNRIEVLCAAVVLTGALVLQNPIESAAHSGQKFVAKWSPILATLLLAIALIYTYWLTPEMSALGLQLNPFEPTTEIPAAMNQLHGSYWFLEALKLVFGGTLLRLCTRPQ